MAANVTGTLPAGQIPCFLPDGSIPQTVSQCLSVTNSSFNTTTSTCICCSTQGNFFNDPTNPTAPCTACTDHECGDPKFCFGNLINPNATCDEDPVAHTWTPVCRANAACGGECQGTCNTFQEWFGFSQCTQNTDTSLWSCRVSFSQWKSWVTYIIIIILAIIFIIFVIVATRRMAITEITGVAIGTTPVGTVAVPLGGVTTGVPVQSAVTVTNMSPTGTSEIVTSTPVVSTTPVVTRTIQPSSVTIV
ncbi:MAG: hypothetical protein Solivirus4_17 [Solivirus sp.]|uniref:Uncharacterized protein n=1 Tax=Solivirus sp. TaxID=2487772 RepID=A0A3G5AFR9_9VIRU|nr:MAG: hypothetical protein Solivirus4_17 [Solivirus sp.]